MLFIRWFCITAVLFISAFCYSAIVVKVRSNKCLVHLEGETAYVGDYYQALNLYGKPMGLLRLEKVKNGKAIGLIIEGFAEPNWILEKTMQRTLPVTSDNQKTDTAHSSVKKNSIGLFLGGHLNFVAKPVTGRGENKFRDFRSTTGSASLFTDFKFANNWIFNVQLGGEYMLLREITQTRRTIGYDCPTSPCQTRFLLWKLPLSVRYYIPMHPTFQLWLGGGLSVIYWGREIDQQHRVFSASHLSNWHNAGHLSLGADIFLKNIPFYIPIALTFHNHFIIDQLQNTFRGKSTPIISLSQISVQVGLAKSI